jgi:putative OPT family oligopeptide transporter
MDSKHTPYIGSQQQVAEITFKGIILSIVLAVVLAMANTFLALKVGLLTSASIPAAILSMGILSLFSKSSILENNLVQTAASAGEAIAGGIVYTIPALIIIGYWTHFSYWQNFFIALIGGCIGVLFSIPLRRILVREPSLHFPEGQAIAEVLKINDMAGTSLKRMLLGGAVGALIELAQTGFKVLANNWQVWFEARRLLFGFGAGFSAAMIGAGYLVGFDLTFSIFLGAIASWGIGVPLLSEVQSAANGTTATHAAIALWGNNLRYVGIGAMLAGGIYTFFMLLKPFVKSLQISFKAYRDKTSTAAVARTDKDMPFSIVVAGLIVSAIACYVLFIDFFPLKQLGLSHHFSTMILVLSLAYVLIAGFVFSAITAYFSGMVGVSASPGSSIIIAGMLIAAVSLYAILKAATASPSGQQLLAAEAITIVIGAIITGAAAIANDNMQDLKVGYILGATPWKQQAMLFLGVLVSSAVIPPVMQLLFSVYGIANVMPHAGMDLTQSLPAPPAAVMAAITTAVFKHAMPWGMMLAGVVIVIVLVPTTHLLRRVGLKISILGFAIGMYLPLASSTPLFIGGLIALMTKRRLQRQSHLNPDDKRSRAHQATLIACGLVAGAALMDVMLAVPFSLAHSPAALSLVGKNWATMAVVLSVVTTLALARWFQKVVSG